VLSVGDAAFQEKCFDEFMKLKADGRTLLFVTHDMSAVERLCDRAILIEQGRIIEEGPPEQVTRRYGEVNFGRIAPAPAGPSQGENGVAAIASAWCESQGERILSLEQGADCTACFEVCFHEAVVDPVFAITFRNEVRHTIFVATSGLGDDATGRFAAGELELERA
jgi:ABC-type uncharacterized transport system ATPase subunit